MSRTEEVLTRAEEHLRGVVGTLALMLTSRRGVTRSGITRMVAQLRAAANTLEELT